MGEVTDCPMVVSDFLNFHHKEKMRGKSFSFEGFFNESCIWITFWGISANFAGKPARFSADKYTKHKQESMIAMETNPYISAHISKDKHKQMKAKKIAKDE